jgi:ABC-type glucose/galactose transport system permease subunit
MPSCSNTCCGRARSTNRADSRSPREAPAAGVVVIHQELSLAPSLSAEENIFLGRFPWNAFGIVNRGGFNQEAARLSGVPVKTYTMIVYVISGFLSGLAGLVYASQLSIGTPIAGQGYEQDAIAAVVVGSTSLFGGSVAGTFLGTSIIGVLANILNLTGVDPLVHQLFKEL